jgi:hypothetical protein
MSYTVIKRNPAGKTTLTYEGEIIERSEHHVCLKAHFKGETRDLGYMLLKHNDLFTEWFYDNRWYNVFKVNDRDTGRLKGFYCNLTRPAEIHETHVAADDLELDVFVTPDGDTLLLDEDEYQQLDLSAHERAQVDNAVSQIKSRVSQHEGPFAALSSD